MKALRWWMKVAAYSSRRHRPGKNAALISKEIVVIVRAAKHPFRAPLVDTKAVQVERVSRLEKTERW